MCHLPYAPFLKLSLWRCLRIIGTGGGDRLREELAYAKYVLCMGKEAWEVCQGVYQLEATPDIKVIGSRLAFPSVLSRDNRIFVKSYHLSAVKLNTTFPGKLISEDVKTILEQEPESWHLTKYRIMLVAKAILAALEAAERKAVQRTAATATQTG